MDFAGSLGLSRSEINAPTVTEKVMEVASAAKNAGLDLVMGGAISSDTISVIQQVHEVHLTRFETRKGRLYRRCHCFRWYFRRTALQRSTLSFCGYSIRETTTVGLQLKMKDVLTCSSRDGSYSAEIRRN